MYKPVYNLEPHNTLDEYYRSSCHSFDFVSMRFVKVIFFPMKFYREIY